MLQRTPHLKMKYEKKMPFKIRKKTRVPRTASSQYGSSPSQRQSGNKSIRKVYKLKRSRGNLPLLVDMIIYRKPQKTYTSVIRIRI